ncbi:MAG TPA: hypothetical protein VF781_00710 [Solirubrobacteraceae bacterium]
MNRPSTRSAAAEPALAADPEGRPLAAEDRVPVRRALLEEEPDLARVPVEPDFAPVLRLEAEDAAAAGLRGLAADLVRRAVPEPELFRVALEPLPFDLRDVELGPEPELPLPPVARLLEPPAREREAAAADPLRELDGVRFLDVLRRDSPLSFSTAMSSSPSRSKIRICSLSSLDAEQEKPA